MVNSLITDVFLQAAEKRLEDKIKVLSGSGPHSNASEIRRDARERYFSEIGLLNGIGKNLTDKGLSVEAINPDAAYQQACIKISDRYEPE